MNITSEPRITLLEHHANEIRNHVCGRADQHERAAWAFFRKFSDHWHTHGHVMSESARYVCVEVIPIPEELILHSSRVAIKIKTSRLAAMMRRAVDENLVIGFVHSHPNGLDKFSPVDDDNELDLLRSLYNRNGESVELVALLVTQDGEWRGRVRTWTTSTNPADARHVVVIGHRISIYVPNYLLKEDAEQFDRQSLAFGEAFTAKLRRLRIAVIGAGGTGSAVATLLVRLGVGELIIIDGDRIETSNLNRVHGSARKDADKKKFKADIQRDYLNSLDLGSTVMAVTSWADEYEGAEALRSADVIFGCTDDHLGRQTLNRAAYFWIQPLFDVGLDASIDNNVTPPELRNLDTRVSIVIPGHGPCLRCQKVIDDKKAAAEELHRRDPSEYSKLEKEAYVRGAGQRNPGVVTYTTLAACIALDEFTEKIQSYKKRKSTISNTWWLFVTESMRHLGRGSSVDCPFCATGKYLLGDERAGLLGRPSLQRKG